MGMVKLELVRAKNYTLVIPTGPRKGTLQSFKGDKEYMVDEQSAEILLGKIDPFGNDVFRLVLDEPAVTDDGVGGESLVEKKTAEAKRDKATAKRRKKARKKTKGKTLDPSNMVVEERASKRKKPREDSIPVGDALEDANEGIPPGYEV